MATNLIPLLATLLVVAHAAAAFRATITTFNSDNQHHGYGGDYPTHECQQEVMSRNLRPCMQFLREQEHRSYGGGDVSLSGRGSRPFYKCCNELQAIRDYSCRCQGLRMEMEKLMGGLQESRRLMSTAETLPRMCGIGPDTCQFSPSRWF